MPPLFYSTELVDLARDASLAMLQHSPGAEPKFRAYIASLRAESSPYPKAILPAYFVTDVDPRAEDGYISAAIAHAAFILELALPTDVIDTFTAAARRERRCSSDERAAVVAARKAHVVWSLSSAPQAVAAYTVTTFPLTFPASAIEVWWPLIRPSETPVLRLQVDGSWQELNADNHARYAADADSLASPAAPMYGSLLAKRA